MSATKEFKDLFSTQSVDYSKYRPTYPKELFQYLSSLIRDHACAWDCGTGSGQAASELSGYFDRVVATDPSEKQLSQAVKDPKIEYRVATAESSTLPDQSVTLVTVAQAFHWFKFEEFYKEVRRVTRPGQSVLAIWSYALGRISPEVDQNVLNFYNGVIGPFWEPERKHVENKYADIPFPFERVQAPAFEMSLDWKVENLIGYLRTWSATQAFVRKNGEDPVALVEPEIRRVWGNPEMARKSTWDLTLLIGRL